jgi:hypothetical protein
VAACAACCTPPIIAFLTAASIGTLISIAMFGVLGLGVVAIAAVVYIRRRAHSTAGDDPIADVHVFVGRKPDA